jgi:hypothetical protein
MVSGEEGRVKENIHKLSAEKWNPCCSALGKQTNNKWRYSADEHDMFDKGHCL